MGPQRMADGGIIAIVGLESLDGAGDDAKAPAHTVLIISLFPERTLLGLGLEQLSKPP